MYDRYSSSLYAICRSYARDPDEAHDILQEGFIKVFQQLKTFDSGKGTFEGWLNRIFINQSIDYYRKRIKLFKSIPVETLSDELPYEQDDPEIYVSEEQIVELILELPLGFRTIFNLFVIEKMKHKEIAELLGIAESTSRTQYIRAKKMMQEKIIQFVSDTKITQ